MFRWINKQPGQISFEIDAVTIGYLDMYDWISMGGGGGNKNGKSGAYCIKI